ncbi:MAG: hypothetical protein AAF226_06455 [Verrucomicrobiota bacterium]
MRNILFLLPILLIGMSCQSIPKEASKSSGTSVILRNPEMVRERSATEPVEIRSPQEAQQWLAAETRYALSDKVDFAREHIVLFAWMGSGGDEVRLDRGYKPEMYLFEYVPGMTRDLRVHAKAYVVSNMIGYDIVTVHANVAQ